MLPRVIFNSRNPEDAVDELSPASKRPGGEKSSVPISTSWEESR